MKGRMRFGVAGRAAGPGHIDLATAAIEIGQTRREAPAKRSVSWRWLSGTVLTGITSTVLMGGALFAALDDPTQFSIAAAARESVAAAPADADWSKSDRIRPVAAPVTSRQLVQVSTISHQDDREVIKLRPFVRINAALTTSRALAANVPPYDPMKILGEAAADGAATVQADQIYGADVDGEVAIKVTPFPLDLAAAPLGDAQLPEVQRVVRDAALSVMDGGVQLAALPYFDARQAAVGDPAVDPFAALGVRIIPENVTFIPKNAAGRNEPAQALNESLVELRRNETLQALLDRSEVGTDDAEDIVTGMSTLLDLAKLAVGDRVRIAFTPTDADGGTPRPLRVSLYRDGVHQATVARSDGNAFVRADEPAPLPDAVATAPLPEAAQMPNLYEALYMTALEQQVPEPLVQELVRIFSYDLDFQSRTTLGDSIQIFHSLSDVDNPDEDEILYAAITVGGVTKRFYRYQTTDDGVIDYYDEEGRSAKKFLMRKPINEGHFTSGFGYRRHPILGYSKLHTGVDWGAPRGTPIMASGDGVIISAGWSSGYGRFTRIRHTNGYETAYGHQDRIANGIVPGAHVHQGQIIGYVGSTGLSTGPHLHYEVRINDRLVDPLEIRLPRGRVLDGPLLADFGAERARIDTLLSPETEGTQFAAAK